MWDFRSYRFHLIWSKSDDKCRTQTSIHVRPKWGTVSTTPIFIKSIIFCCSSPRSPQWGQGLLIAEASRTHSNTAQWVGLLWTNEQADAETSTWQHTTLRRYSYPALGGIRTRNPSNRSAADLRCRPRGLWDRLKFILTESNYMDRPTTCPNPICWNPSRQVNEMLFKLLIRKFQSTLITTPHCVFVFLMDCISRIQCKFCRTLTQTRLASSKFFRIFCSVSSYYIKL
jgi:hypothetical protein